MRYYCNECKKTITMEEFQYSMNKFGKALCKNHQRDKRISETTKDLRALVRNRHKDELKKEIPNLITIKDWIKADFETWDKAIKKDDDGSYIIKVSEEDMKNSYSKRIKNKDKS
jgi:hypothetical protein